VTPTGPGSLSLQWTDNASDETGFEVERASEGSAVFIVQHTAGANATGWIDTGLNPSTTYTYRVRAVNGVGPSALTAAVPATTAAAPTPAAPTGLTATQELAGSSITIRLAWTDVAADETGYEVRRSTDGAVSWGATVALPAGATSYVDSATLGLVTHTYEVRAVNGGGPSAWLRVELYNGPMLTGYICPEPTGAAASATSTTAIHVTWTWSTCLGVAVERAPAATGPWTEVARVPQPLFYPPPTTGTFDDAGLSPGTTYHYRLRAVPNGLSGYTSSTYGAPVSATTQVPAGPPAPSGLAATVTGSETATLTWTDTASGETAFAVEYATAAGGPWTEAFRRPANTTQAGVNGMTAATSYWFRVRTVAGTLTSAPSNVVSFTTASVVALRVTGDATVMESTAASINQTRNISGSTNDVGCYYNWTVDTDLRKYYWHNCGGSALRFDTSALAGKTILSAALRMFPCALAPDPVTDAQYVVRALAGPWNPATVTFNTLPNVYTAGGWALPAPTAGGEQRWDVTTIVQSWASGAWANNGLFVQQSPLVDVRTFYWAGSAHDWQDQTTSYCSLEQTGGSLDYVPTLLVDYR
jgi:hypothetical protein